MFLDDASLADLRQLGYIGYSRTAEHEHSQIHGVPDMEAVCGRLWLISDVFVMFWISLYRFVLLRSDWESV